MNPHEQFRDRMEQIYEREQMDGDMETTHGQADDLMCEVLRDLGYGAGVDVYLKLTRWMG